MDIGIGMFIKACHRGGHLPRALRRGGAIEIDQRLAVDFFGEDGKVRAVFLGI